MSRLAIDVMGHLCWKTDLGAIAGDHDQFYEPVHTMLDAIQRYTYVPLPAAVLAILPTPMLRRCTSKRGERSILQHPARDGAAAGDKHGSTTGFTQPQRPVR